MKKPVYYVLIAVLLLVFGFSAFQVVRYFQNSKNQQNQFDQLSQLASGAASESTQPATQASTTQATEPSSADTQATEPTQPAEPTEPSMIPGYADVYAQNPDLVGWIRIDNTRINYPVMQTPEDPDYYLKRDFNGNYSEWGCIFADANASLTEPSDNITLYGHCMNDGSMFAGLHEYMSYDYLQEHPLIYFDTLTEYHVYEIFAVFKTSANLGEGFRYHAFVDAEDEAAYNEFVDTCLKLSVHDTGIRPEYGDALICLSTCEYSYDNGRLVVAARRIF